LTSTDETEQKQGTQDKPTQKLHAEPTIEH